MIVETSVKTYSKKLSLNDKCSVILRIKFLKKMDTRSGEMASLQIGKMGVISGLNDSSFSIPGNSFNLKNDGETAVILSVNLSGMEPGEFVTTRFETGWNPEIIKEIKQTSLSNLNLKWGN